jgi:hypothetical protein
MLKPLFLALLATAPLAAFQAGFHQGNALLHSFWDYEAEPALPLVSQTGAG